MAIFNAGVVMFFEVHNIAFFAGKGGFWGVHSVVADVRINVGRVKNNGALMDAPRFLRV
ncbi:hypothetical protein XFLM_07260 [Xylella fastidiosa subsp. fastidiosa GB514]|nr:hypothetical protein XFLM_07260 [Xylella fastidiosa subsp. fastidiosa GB514]